MTTSDVATALGLTVRSVQLWVEQGALEGWKTPGGHRRITRVSFNKFSSNVVPGKKRDKTRLNIAVVEDSLAMQKLYRLTWNHGSFPLMLILFQMAVRLLFM